MSVSALLGTCLVVALALVTLAITYVSGRRVELSEEADDGTRTHDLLHGKQTL
jgi:hypothetical protein